jgi:hypothetical protein
MLVGTVEPYGDKVVCNIVRMNGNFIDQITILQPAVQQL